MGIYTRHQLLILLALVATAGLGIAVGQWRQAHPDLVERLEQIDRESPTAPDGLTWPADATTSTRAPLTSEASRRRPAGRSPKLADATGEPQWRPPPRPRSTKLAANDEGAGSPASIDVNAAGIEELIRLPGVGAVLAARIVEAREVERFTSVDDLRRVRGLGPSKFERLRSFVTVGMPPDGTPPARQPPPRAPAVSSRDGVAPQPQGITPRPDAASQADAPAPPDRATPRPDDAWSPDAAAWPPDDE